jgi:hypothetical protein
MALTVVPKAVCDPENFSKSNQANVHFRGFFLHTIRVNTVENLPIAEKEPSELVGVFINER